MRVAIVHYHLRPGGVTRVIEQTTAALTARGIANIVLCEDNLQGLGYGGEDDPKALAERLLTAATTALGNPPDIWIFHNPTLGKNRDIPHVIERFARDGIAMLLHIHDLAEDGRAQNFQNIPDPTRLHCTAPRVHHAFINSRDRDRFVQAGLPQQRAHLLPNPVAIEPWNHESSGHDTQVTSSFKAHLVFYPVRGIRRKNLGELCLLAALAPQGTRFATSRAPENPEEIPTHDFWRHFAIAQRLPVSFDVTDRLSPFPGHPSDFASWCKTSTHWISTSVAEGFGQTLAEAAAIGKPCIARALDAGFTPTDTHRIYARILLRDGKTDFASLDESAQAGIIRRALASPEFAESLTIDQQPTRDWLHDRLHNHAPIARDPQLDSHTPQHVATTLHLILRLIIKEQAGPVEYLPQHNLARLYQGAPQLITHPYPAARSQFPRAIIFDIYGTLLDAPPGGIRPDPNIDSTIIHFLERHSIKPPAEPSAALAELVQREHAASTEAFPEIDLVALWAELLNLPRDRYTAWLAAEIEDLWHPATPMPGVMAMLRRLAASNIPCGLLSNAQSNVWRQLGELAPCFASDLCTFSYQHRCAKPSPRLFDEIKSRLARRGIAPQDVCFIGNDPFNDIAPGITAGFRTALYGNAESHSAMQKIHTWNEFRPE